MKYVYLLSLFILACNPKHPGTELLQNGGFDDRNFTGDDQTKMVPYWRPISCDYTPDHFYVSDYENKSVLLMQYVYCGMMTTEYAVPPSQTNYTITVHSKVVLIGEEGLEKPCQGVEVLLTWFAPELDKWSVGEIHRVCSFEGRWMKHEFYGSIPPWATLVRLALLQEERVSSYVDDVSLVVYP